MPLLRFVQNAVTGLISDFREKGMIIHLPKDGLDIEGDIDGGWLEDWLQLKGKFSLHLKSRNGGSLLVIPAKRKRVVPKPAKAKKKATNRKTGKTSPRKRRGKR